MIVAMQEGADEQLIQQVIEHLVKIGFEVHRSTGARMTVLGAVGSGIDFDIRNLELLPGVQEVHRISSPYKLAGRSFRPEGTIVKLANGIDVGGNEIVVMAGPCSVESREQILTTAEAVAKAGAKVLRGGAFKPRTSPYSFQGLGEQGLRILRDVGHSHGLPVVTEVMDPRQVDLVLRYTDMFQIGARNMQNFDLLKEVGQTRKPVLLKRGMSATVKDLLMSAEYILSEGNPGVVLCERGVRSFEDSTRNMLDMSAVPNVKGQSHLPIIVDPSHATGRPDLIPAMARASVAAEADGVHIEVHFCPPKALSDGAQALLPAQYESLMKDLRRLAEVMGKMIS